MLTPGASIPIDAGADERAVYLAGRGELDGMPLAPMQLYVLRPGVATTLRSATGGRVMLCGGDAFATKRHVWWNFVCSRHDGSTRPRPTGRPGDFQGAGGREGVDPDPGSADDGELSIVSAFDPIVLKNSALQ